MLRGKPPRIVILSLLLSLVVFSIAWAGPEPIPSGCYGAGEGYVPPVVGNISSDEAWDETVITSPSGGEIYVRTAQGELLEGSWPVSFAGWVCAEPTLADLDDNPLFNRNPDLCITPGDIYRARDKWGMEWGIIRGHD
jgi:hypothetical protein